MSSPFVSTTGKIDFPPIFQDNSEVYEHNICQTFNELNTDEINQPLILSILGTDDPTEIDLEYLDHQFFYTHKLLDQLVKDSTYIPTELATQRSETTYDNTTLIHLTNPKATNQQYLYEHNIQISALLSYIMDRYPPT